MHGAKWKILHHAYDLVVNGSVKPYLTYACTHHFTDGLIQRFDTRFIYDHGITVINVTHLKIAACNELKFEGFRKIKVHIELIPLQLLIRKFRELHINAYPAEIIQPW